MLTVLFHQLHEFIYVYNQCEWADVSWLTSPRDNKKGDKKMIIDGN